MVLRGSILIHDFKAQFANLMAELYACLQCAERQKNEGEVRQVIRGMFDSILLWVLSEQWKNITLYKHLISLSFI